VQSHPAGRADWNEGDAPAPIHAIALSVLLEIIMSLSERRVNVGRITLNIREGGEGPAIIFLHGITANAAVWDPILLTLQDSFRVIAVDQRGHGKSDKPAAGYGAADFSQDALDLIQTLGKGPAIIVGHSLGARNGIVAAASRPDLVAGVVAVDFTPFIETEVFDTLEARVNGGDRSFASREEIVDYLASRYPRMPRDAVERRARHGYREENGVFLPLAAPSAMSATANGLREDLEPAIRQVRKPVLMIRGMESKLVSAPAFERTLRLRPDLPSLVVPDTDHYVPEEAPAIVSKAIRDFAKAL
jgi:2-(acetamidomethylene)succinate hydrolase